MRKTIAIALLMTLALPAVGQECRSVEIAYEGQSPYIVKESGLDDGNIRLVVVGQFLWVQYGRQDNPDSMADDIVSETIPPDTARATACLDGVVTFESALVPEVDTDKIGTAVTATNLAEVYPDIIPGSLAVARFNLGVE